MTIEEARRGNQIIFRPYFKGESFPEFDEVEIRKGFAYGWSGSRPCDIGMVTLGKVPDNAVLKSKSTKEIIFEISK